MNKIIVLMMFLISFSAIANRVNTLEGDNILPRPTEMEVASSAEKIKLPPNLSVPDEWKPFLNPAYEEFWNEGNHKADSGFILFARNPTKDNAKLWLLRMETKAKYLEVMMAQTLEAQKELVGEGVMEDRYGMVQTAANIPESSKKVKINIKELLKKGREKENKIEMFFIFSPTCPHCERMSESLLGFKNVQPLQVGSGEIKNFKGLSKTEMASSETLQTYAKDRAVPVLVIHDPKSKKVNVIKGYLSKEEIYISIAKLFEERG